MARLWSGGFELNSATNAIEYSTGGYPTIQTTVVRSGTYACQINSLVSATAKSVGFQVAATATDITAARYTRAYFRFATLPSAENTIIRVRSQASVNRIWVTIDNTGVLKLYDEDSQIGSASSALSLNTWYRIELYWDVSAGGGSHIVRARLDGSEFAGASNRNLTTGMNNISWGGNLRSEAQTQGNWFIDDCAINDETGSTQTSYPGEGKIVHLRPNAAGDSNTFATQTGGTAGAANNFTRVDEVTPNDATDFNGSNTLNQTDDFNVTNPPDAIYQTDTITLVQVGARFRASAAGTNSTFVLRCKAASGGTTSESAGITPTSTSWTTNDLAFPRHYLLTLYNDPDGAAWTKGKLLTAQIGYRISSGNTNRCDISTEWLLVEFVQGTRIQDVIGGGTVPSPR